MWSAGIVIPGDILQWAAGFSRAPPFHYELNDSKDTVSETIFKKHISKNTETQKLHGDKIKAINSIMVIYCRFLESACSKGKLKEFSGK